MDDVACEARARLPTAPRLGEIIAVVDEIVRAEADRCGRRCVAILSPGDGVPRLLAAFQNLSDLHPRPRHIQRALGSAAVAIAKTVLDYERFHLFFLAWVEGESIAGILDTRGEPPEQTKAVQRRLRRLSESLDKRLLERLDASLAHRERVWLRAAVGAPTRRKRGAAAIPPPDAASWTTLMKALDEVVHRRRAPRTSPPGPGAEADLGL